MSPNRNIELKAQCRDLKSARDLALGIGARDAGVLVQTDTYFHVANGRLKLREIESHHAELIWYDRPNHSDSRASNYHLVPIPDPALLKISLAAAVGVRGQVKKCRQLLLWRNVRIHLDDVEQLGTFIEFEAVLSDVETEAEGHERLRELSERLGIEDADRIAVSYSDLLGL